MRWYDIDLTRTRQPIETTANTWSFEPLQAEVRQIDGLLSDVQVAVGQLSELQQRKGLDSPAVVNFMAEVGQMMFQAVTRIQPDAFCPRRDHEGGMNPQVGLAETDHVVGYHLCVPSPYLGLPWGWLHNGVGFLLERYALCAAPHRSNLPGGKAATPWMKKLLGIQLEQQIGGSQPLRKLLTRLRPRDCADPEILFVPGHCDEKIRRLIFREADGIKNALVAGALGRPLARLKVPTTTVTPTWLARRGCAYQGIHFAGPTAQLPTDSETEAATWFTGLLADLNDPTVRRAALGSAPAEGHEEDLPWDLELELVGVDPITALLDTVAAKAEAGGSAGGPASPPVTVTATLPRAPWWLEDGPFQPEDMAPRGSMPALVFSNSHCSVPELSARFLAAGASVFLGPVAPLYSRPARKFAGRFYNFLSDGHCAATALRTAALACQSEFGADHPAWLSYGITGYGSLALQYL